MEEENNHTNTQDQPKDHKLPTAAKVGLAAGAVVVAGGALLGYVNFFSDASAQTPAAVTAQDPNAAAAAAKSLYMNNLGTFMRGHSDQIPDVSVWYVRMDPSNPNPVLEDMCGKMYGAEHMAKVVTGRDGNPYYVVKNTPEIATLVGLGNPDRAAAAQALGMTDLIQLDYMLEDTLFEHGIVNQFVPKDPMDPNQGFYTSRMAEILPAEKTVPKVTSPSQVDFGSHDYGQRLELMVQPTK